MNNKQILIKETRKKIQSLLLGFQEPLISEFSKFPDLRKLQKEIRHNTIKLQILMEKELFNNKESKKNE